MPEEGRTFGEMSAEEKHTMSHRARAAAAARPALTRLAGIAPEGGIRSS
ncbi:MAG: non-canonical purine NTP pyrophosphatase [Ktedonobacterales bacterium]